MMTEENTLDEKRNLIRKRRMMNGIVFVIFFAVSAIYYTKMGNNQVALSVQEASLIIEVPKKSEHEVRYEQILSVTLQDAPSYGQAVDGGIAGKCNYGIWQNEQWGTYYCYALTNVKDCIVLETDEGIVAFNFENEDATEAFYEAFLEKMNAFQ